MKEKHIAVAQEMHERLKRLAKDEKRSMRAMLTILMDEYEQGTKAWASK